MRMILLVLFLRTLWVVDGPACAREPRCRRSLTAARAVLPVGCGPMTDHASGIATLERSFSVPGKYSRGLQWSRTTDSSEGTDSPRFACSRFKVQGSRFEVCLPPSIPHRQSSPRGGADPPEPARRSLPANHAKHAKPKRSPQIERWPRTSASCKVPAGTAGLFQALQRNSRYSPGCMEFTAAATSDWCR